MSFVSGNTSSYQQPEQKLAGVDAQKLSTDEAARPLPVLWGRNRLGVTFISNAFNQKVEPVRQKLGKEEATTGYTYTADFAALVCHGTVSVIHGIYLDDVLVWPEADENGFRTPFRRNETDPKVVRVEVLNGGSGYLGTDEITVNFSGGGGTGAHGRAFVRDGRIAYVLVTSLGSGYHTTPSVVMVGATAGSGATFSVVTDCEPWVDITLPGGLGSWRIHWGTENADFDPLLLTLSADRTMNPDGVEAPNQPEEHPAYTGQCYLVARGHNLGYQKTQVPNIELVVGRYPQEGGRILAPWIEDDCAIDSIIADALTHTRYGLGLAPERISQAGIDAFHDQLLEEDLAVSPVVSRSQPLRQFLIQLLEYVDGFHTTTSDGLFTLGLMRVVLPEHPPTRPVFDESCLIEEPEITVSGWTGTRNLVHVKYTNAYAEYAEDSVAGKNLGNFTLKLEPSPMVLERPWVTRPTTAQRVAAAAALSFSHETVEGTLVVRKSRLQGLTAGGTFWLQYGHYGICWMPCRCRAIRTSDPYAPQVEISFEKDRGLFFEGNLPLNVVEPPKPILQPVTPFSEAMVIELPGMGESVGVPLLAALAARPTAMTNLFQIMLRVAPSSYGFQKEAHRFALRATLQVDFAEDATGPIRLVTSGVDAQMPEISSTEGAADAWLLLMGEEILSVWSPVLQSGTPYHYEATVAREKLDSRKESHAAGAAIWIVQLDALRDLSFLPRTVTAAGTVDEVKLLPVVAGSVADLSTVDPLSVTWTDRCHRPWKQREFAGPESWAQNSGDLVFTWTENNRRGGPFKPAAEGEEYILDIRPSSAPWDYSLAKPEAGPGAAFARKRLIPPLTQCVVSSGSLYGALGLAEVEVAARLWSRANGFNSRHYNELIIPTT